MISWTGANKPIKKVGLIGCGRMGRCMLEGMLAKGYSVVVYDKFPTAAQSASALGSLGIYSPVGGCSFRRGRYDGIPYL